MNRRHLLSLTIGATAAQVSGCRRRPKLDTEAYHDDILAVIKNHAEVCSSAYRIAWQKADTLRGGINLFLAQPDARSWAAVREAWANAILAYMETEGLRGFSTPADTYHRRIQAWPVEPAELDTVPGKPKSGIVHDKSILPDLTADALIQAHQPSTGDVLIGFHPLEFLIFGIDLYDDGGGYRAFTDYTPRAMGAPRRRQLLEELAELLSRDLKQLSEAWHPAQQANYRAQFMRKEPAEALGILFTGLASPCATGLDSKLTRALKSGDQKDEVCNFSDTSLEAIRHAIIGLQKALTGEAPGRVVTGEEKPLLGLITKADPSLASDIESGFANLSAQLGTLDQPFDQLIKPGNASRQVLEKAVESLTQQHEWLQDAARAVGAKGTFTA